MNELNFLAFKQKYIGMDQKFLERYSSLGGRGGSLLIGDTEGMTPVVGYYAHRLDWQNMHIRQREPGESRHKGEGYAVLNNPTHYAEVMREFFPNTSEATIVIGATEDHVQKYYDAVEWMSKGMSIVIIASYADALRKLKTTSKHQRYQLFTETLGGDVFGIGVWAAGSDGDYPEQEGLQNRTHLPSRVLQKRGMVRRVAPAVRNEAMRCAYDDEEGRSSKPDVYLDKTRGILKFRDKARTRLLVGDAFKEMNSRCHDSTPPALAIEKSLRSIMQSSLQWPIVMDPEARASIEKAVAEAEKLVAPIMPPTDFELVAYADERDALKALPKPVACSTIKGYRPVITASRSYKIDTGVYNFMEKFTRTKLEIDEVTQMSKTVTHHIERTGEDRMLRLLDDNKRVIRFCDRPKAVANGVGEDMLWQVFERPHVQTVKEMYPERYAKNHRIMNLMEMMGQFTYYPGQREYYARIGCRDAALIAAEVGTGKTLGALSLVAMQSPRRTLIMAPQGTMRSPNGEEERYDNAAQWVKEIRKFAPAEPVFQLFSVKDYEKIVRLHKGKLPDGIYISYPHAMYSNQCFDHLPATWKDLAPREIEQRFRKRMKNTVFKGDLDVWYHQSVGVTRDSGISCVALPNLATRIGDAWDMVILDEAHLISNLSTFITRNFIRTRAKYRYAMTATPIPNVVSDIFPVMGWLSVPDWFKGYRRNAQWPYALGDFNSFTKVFMSQERDVTQERINRVMGKKNPRSVRASAIISSPSRLLKLLKPTLGFIDKKSCNANMMPCNVKDVRVPLGEQQAQLYRSLLDPAKLPYKSALTRARVHNQVLRGVCAHPKINSWNKTGIVASDFNPKTATVLEVLAKELKSGEQVLVSCARLGQTDELERRLIEAGVKTSRIDGTVTASAHSDQANAFKRGETHVMLMGIKCALGHDFYQCSRMVIASIEWGYGVLHQAEGRVYRLNSPKPVEVTVILNENTIEETIFDRVAQKQDAATICLHGQRVPHNIVQLDADDILAQHIVDWKSTGGRVKAETECEKEWPALKKALQEGAAKMAAKKKP